MERKEDEALNIEQGKEVERKVKEFLKERGMVIPESAQIAVSIEEGEITEVIFIEGEPQKLH